MRTGRTFPCLSWVRALNCLQNSIILIPFEPRAGPMGGAGLACPPLHWSLTKAVISFAIIKFLVLTSRPGRDSQFMISTKELFWECKGIEINYPGKSFLSKYYFPIEVNSEKSFNHKND